MISFFVPGPPAAKERPRFAGHAFTPARTARAEKDVRWYAREAMRGREPLEGPLELRVEAVYARPKSWPKKRQREFWRVGRPDFDNIAKLIADALNGIVWRDDAQVALATIARYYADEPGTHVRVAAAPAMPEI